LSDVERLSNRTTGGPVFVDVDGGKIVLMTLIDLSIFIGAAR